MTTVYHTPDGRVLAALQRPDPEWELTQRLAGVRVRKFDTDQIIDPAQCCVAVESGRVAGGKVVFGADDVASVVSTVAIDEVRAAVRTAVAEELAPMIATAVAAAITKATAPRGES